MLPASLVLKKKCPTTEAIILDITMLPARLVFPKNVSPQQQVSSTLQCSQLAWYKTNRSTTAAIILNFTMLPARLLINEKKTLHYIFNYPRCHNTPS
jgi:hypothetical protein